MTLLIAQNEFLALRRDRRFLTLAAALAVLVLVSVWLGLGEQHRVRAERSQAEAAERDNWMQQGPKNPHSAAHYGSHAFKPASPLAWFDPGLDPWLGSSTYLEAHAQNHLEHPPAADLGGLPRFGFMTPAWLLQTLVPLLIVLTAAGSVAGEREVGTLRQALALGASPRAWLAGKTLGLGGALSLLLAPISVGLVLISGWAGSREDAARATLATLGYGTYFAAYLFLAVAASAWLPSARAALVGLLAFWMTTTLVGPRVVADVIASARPLPSLAEFNRGMRADLHVVPDGHSSSGEARNAREQELLRQHGITNVALLPFNISGLYLQEGEEQANPILDRHFNALADRIEAQNRLRLRAGIAAPVLAVEQMSMALAGTDFTRHRRFAAAAEQHRRVMVKMLNEDMTTNSRYGDWKYKADAALWARVPEFHFAPTGAGEAFRQAGLELALLAAWLAAGFGLLCLAARRLNP
jgi:ABC-2 type transport system permease protein